MDDAGIHYIHVGGQELSKIGYDELMNSLYVRLKNEQLLVFYDVPDIELVSLLSANEMEQYYNERIKHRYNYRVVH